MPPPVPWPEGPPFPGVTQEQFMSLVRRLLPDHYVIPLLDPGPGGELLEAMAAVFERASESVSYSFGQMFVLTALGARRAETVVEFHRGSAAAGAVTVRKGTIVTAPRGRRDFVLVEDVVFGAADVGPHGGRVVARWPGTSWNVRGQRATAGGEVLPGEISEITRLAQTPEFGDPSVRVRQPSDAAGGRLGLLDALGKDKGVLRLPGEADSEYRARIRALPDTVSPAAIRRVANRLLAPHGLEADLVETFEHRYQSCWDAPAQSIAGSAFDPNLFCYDDPRPSNGRPAGFVNRWLDDNDARGAFLVVLSRLRCLRDVGMAYDDTAAGAVELDGRRGAGAWDVPQDANAALLQGGFDGFDLPRRAVYKGLRDVLQTIKAAGTVAGVELQPLG